MPATALSRADLLRVLGAHPEAAVDRMAALCGLHPDEDLLALNIAATAQLNTPDTMPAPERASPVSEVAPRPASQARLFQAWQHEMPVVPGATEQGRLPLTLEELLPKPESVAATPALLMRPGQLWPAVKRSLSRTVAGDVDVDALIAQLAQGQSLEVLPQVQEKVWRAPLWVIWDQASRLEPYQSDYQLLYDLLLRMRGEAALTLFSFREDACWVHWTGRDGRRLAKLPQAAPGTAILLLSDLGALASASWIEARWLALLQSWNRQALALSAWLPTAPGHVHVRLARHAAIHHLSTSGRLRPQRRGWHDAAQRRQLQTALRDRLLELASCAVHVSTDLLRALRRLDDTLRDQPGAEALAWTAEVVGRSDSSRPLLAKHAPGFRAKFQALPVPLQQAVSRCLQELHATHGRTTPWLEQLLWGMYCAPAARDPGSDQRIAEARDALQRLTQAGAGAELASDIEKFACDVVDRQRHDRVWWQSENAWVGGLLQLAQPEQLPAGLSPEQRMHARLPGPVHACYLAQRGDALWLMPSRIEVPPGQRLTADFLTDLVIMEGKTDARGHAAPPLPVQDQASELRRPLQAATLWTRQQRIEITEIPRPAWAWEFGRDAEGVYVLTPPLGTRQAKFYALPEHQASAGQPFLPDGRDELFLEWQDGETRWRLGFDTAFGAFAELQRGQALQRFRWIVPGEFWMGSLEKEGGSADERPRHRVRISAGFWLADTACTQALWQAVMGKNPSHFTRDLQCPVERVSWYDVQAFLKALRLPTSLTPDLPTEAEWEYACRAGTESVFHFGTQITPEVVNYDGNFPYAGGKTWEYRQRTVPVKALPASDWGLFQMHGNVWEWCRDGQRMYVTTQTVVEDPEGPMGKEEGRVLRGGSWSSRAIVARSAFRFAFHPGDRHRGNGFRFVLRSTSPAAEPELVLSPGTAAALQARPGRRATLESTDEYT